MNGLAGGCQLWAMWTEMNWMTFSSEAKGSSWGIPANGHVSLFLGSNLIEKTGELHNINIHDFDLEIFYQ